MDDARPTTSDEEPRTSRFELAPPRRFVLPAILLLLSEAPGHGYSLEKDLREMNFGRIDRPTVYRALAQLEKDGLVESRADVPAAGHERRVYGVTPLGERVLGVWMSVIKEERDLLGRVLRRYQATGAPRCHPGRGRRRLGRRARLWLVAGLLHLDAPAPPPTGGR